MEENGKDHHAWREEKSRVNLPLTMNKNNKIYSVDLAVEAPVLGGQ